MSPSLDEPCLYGEWVRGPFAVNIGRGPMTGMQSGAFSDFVLATDHFVASALARRSFLELR